MDEMGSNMPSGTLPHCREWERAPGRLGGLGLAWFVSLELHDERLSVVGGLRLAGDGGTGAGGE